MNPTLVLIPTYNEKDNVAPLVHDIFSAVSGVDVLFIDDASPDGTGEVLDGLSESDDRIHILHRKTKEGLGSAYLAGFARSLEQGYKFTICMDADFSHDPQQLSEFIVQLQEHDLVSGSRYCKGGSIQNWSFHRRFLSKGAALYARLLTRMPFSDPTGGFTGYRNSILKQLPLSQIRSRGYAFQIEMKHTAWKHGFRHSEIPIVFTERRTGKSKMSAGIVREAFQVVWNLVLHQDSANPHTDQNE